MPRLTSAASTRLSARRRTIRTVTTTVNKANRTASNVLTTVNKASKAMSDATITTVVVTTAIIVVLDHNKADNKDRANAHNQTTVSKAIVLSKPTSKLILRSLRPVSHRPTNHKNHKLRKVRKV